MLEQQFPIASICNSLYGSDDEHLPRLLGVKGLLSLSQDRRWLACAAGKRLEIADSTSRSDDLAAAQALPGLLLGKEVITALTWISFVPSKFNSAEVTFLLVGTSFGYLQWHTTQGKLLSRQRLHLSACCSIEIRTKGQGLQSEDTSEEVTVGFARGVVRISALEILSFYLQISRDGGFSSEGKAALSHTKWEFPRSTGKRHAVFCVGLKVPPLRDRMLGQATSLKVSMLSGGESPALAAHEAPEYGDEGVMAIVSELASGIAGLAKTLAKGRPNGYRAGLGSWLGRSGKQEQLDPEKVIPQPGHSSSLDLSIPDEARIVTSIVVCPRGCLAAAADSLGRVLLFDFSSLTVLRIWKSYRHVQIGWLSSSDKGSPNSSFLVLFSSKRARLEIWEPRGERLLDAPVCRHGVLLNQLPKFGSSLTSDAPCLLDCETGDLCSVQALFEKPL